MREKISSISFVLLLVLMSWSNYPFASASSSPITTVSISSTFSGTLDDNGFVYSEANPEFTLSVFIPNNGTSYGSEYRISSNSTLTNPIAYSGPFTYWQNHSEEIELSYRSNASTGQEGWNLLTVSVDADQPLVSVSSQSNLLNRYLLNSSVYVTSQQVPLSFSCADSLAGVSTFNASIGNFTHSSPNNSIELSPNILPGWIQSNSPFVVQLTCVDFVGNEVSELYSVIIDDSTPVLNYIESGLRIGTCTSLNWSLSATSTDAHSTSSVEVYSNSTWIPFLSPQSFDSGFNGSVALRAADSSGLYSTPTSWNVTIDSSPPQLSTTSNQTELFVNSFDDCGVSSTQVKWEQFDGTLSSWYQVTTPSIFIPESLNGSIVRATVQSTDLLGNQIQVLSNWMNTNASNPTTQIFMMSSYINQLIGPNFQVLLSPTGYQTTTLWELEVNNQTVDNGSISAQYTLNSNFSHGDFVRLILHSTDGLGSSSSLNYSWEVDASNSHQVPLFLSGQYLNTSQLYLGGSGRITPGQASDDFAGSGGDFVSCTWNNLLWWNALSNPLVPSSISNSTSEFTLGCRSVDLLGNAGPTTWTNGSVELIPPSLNVWPISSSTVSPTSSLQFLLNDSSGIAASPLYFVWTNGLTSMYTNTTVGVTNWSASVSQLFPSATNGILSASIQVTDLLGNTQLLSGYQWTLNTSQPFSSITLSNAHGSFLKSNGSGISLALPSGGWSGVWSSYSLTDHLGTTVLSGNVTTSTLLSPVFSTQGQVWLNTTTGDSFGKTQDQTWTFTVDSSNSQSPIISIQGTNLSINSIVFLSPNAKLRIQAINDDGSGVGGSHASCSYDGVSWFTQYENSETIPSSLSNAHTAFQFRCLNVDHLGNQGPLTWLNFTVDAILPQHTLSPPSTTYIGPSSIIQIQSSDTNGISSSLLQLTWTNGVTSQYHNITIGTSNWNASIQSLFSSPSDGSVVATLKTTDSLGNLRTSTGYGWTLSTMPPQVSLTLSGNSSGLFITEAGSVLLLNGLVGGNGTYAMNYSITDSQGVLLYSGSSVSSSVSVTPSNLVHGHVWLNSSITDSFGRSGSFSWQLSVDNENSIAPIISIKGANLTIDSSIWVGPSTQFELLNRLDDSTGVGIGSTRCSWDATSWFTYDHLTGVSLSSTPGQTTSANLRCKNLDIFGNEGPVVQLNMTVDASNPTSTLTPGSNSYLSLSTAIGFQSNDASQISHSILSLIWSNGQQSWYHNSTVYSSYWNTTLSSLNNSLSDGTLQVELSTWDIFGNSRIISGQIWNLNTSQPLADVELSGLHVGTFISSNGSLLKITPPSAGNQVGWTSYTLQQVSGQNLYSNNISTSTVIELSNLSSGLLWLNISSGDQFSRFQSQSFTYTIDIDVLSYPTLQLSGTNISLNSATLLAPNSGYSVVSFTDDSGGVGSSHIRCTWDGQNWFTSSLNSVLSPSHSSGSMQAYTLGCSTIDLLGNVGPVLWRNGSTDAQDPTISFGVLAGSLLSAQSMINSTCSDSSGCQLIEIGARFIAGASTTWHSLSLSGISSNQSLSSLLNVNVQGSVSFYIRAVDSLGNEVNMSTETHQYLHDSPTISYSVSSTISSNYIGEFLNFSVNPSTGWMTGISVTLNVSHSLGTSSSATINQSSSLHSYSNLSEGQIWLNSTICNSLNLCTSTSLTLFVDRTGASSPSLTLTTASSQANQSLVAQGNAQISLFAGIDSASGILSTNCSSGSQYFVFTSAVASISVQSLLSEGWGTITCISTDRVNNQGSSASIVLYRDDTYPVINVSSISLDGVLTPGQNLNATCSDAFNTLLSVEISTSQSTLYIGNTSGAFSVPYLTLFGQTPHSDVQISISCRDEAGNLQSSSLQVEWLPYLEPSTITVSIIQRNNILYVSPSSSISLSNSRSDIYHKLRVIIDGQSQNWVVVNGSTLQFSTLSSGYSNNHTVIVEAQALRHGTSFDNRSYSSSFKVDLIGPILSIVDDGPYGNSTEIQFTSVDYGVGGMVYYWTWDNTTLSSSSQSSDVKMLSDSSASSWLEIYAVDQLGNIGTSVSGLLLRDTSPPAITLNESHPGYLSEHATLVMSIEESTGIQSSTYYLESSSGQKLYLANNTSSFTFTPPQSSSWIWSESSMILHIEVYSVSGLYSSLQRSLTVDSTVPTASIDSQNSVYIYGQNTSNSSQIVLLTSTDTGTLCYHIGASLGDLLLSNCTQINNSEFQFNRLSGAYLIQINISDYAGNQNQVLWNLEHHTSPPDISVNLTGIVRSGTAYPITTESLFATQISALWDNSTLSVSSATLVIPSGTGTHTLSLHVRDSLGLVNWNNYSVTLDSISPSLTFEGLRYLDTTFGTNTTLWLNSSDAQSFLQAIQLNISSPTGSCEVLFNPQATSFAKNGTLSDYFSSNSCSFLTNNMASLSITLSSTDAVGNSVVLQYTTQYYGNVSLPEWNHQYTEENSLGFYVSANSILTCGASAGVLGSLLELNWSESTGTVSNLSVLNFTSGGVLTCTQSDEFGNSAFSSITLSFDISPPEITILWPSSRFGTLIRATGSSFTLDANDSEVSVTTLSYCIASTSCEPLLFTNGSIPLGLGSGSQVLSVRVENSLGVASFSNLSFTVDNQYPYLNLSNGFNTVLDGSVLYIASAQSELSVSLADDYCIAGGELTFDTGNYSLANTSNYSIPSTTTSISLEVTDCVGHTTYQSLNVQTLSSISVPAIDIEATHLNSSFISNSQLMMDGSVVLELHLTHPIELSLLCESVTAVITCQPLPNFNSFLIELNATVGGSFNLTLSDSIGNSIVTTNQYLVDLEGPICGAFENVIYSGSTVIVSSNFNSKFQCSDTINSIDQIYWDDGSSPQYWSLSNQVWNAPVPLSSTIELVAVDSIGNVRRSALNVIFDNQPPTVQFDSISKISFDEKVSQSDGSFNVSCFEVISGGCTLVVIMTTLTGESLSSQTFTNQGTFNIQGTANIQSFILQITSFDTIGNQFQSSDTIALDDISPQLSTSNINPNNGEVIDMNVVSSKGIIRVDGLFNSDVNLTLSFVSIDCIDDGTVLASLNINSVFVLSLITLNNCAEIRITFFVIDHAGNVQTLLEIYSVDYFTPVGILEVQDTCSWNSGNIYDTTMDCRLDVNITDDVELELRGIYVLRIESSDSSFLYSENLTKSTTIPFYEMNNLDLIISLTGQDLVGNQIQSSSIRVKVRPNLEPNWDGVICRNNTQCTWEGVQVISATNSLIGVTVLEGHAPINVSSFRFESATNPVSFDTPFFAASAIPEGTYNLIVNFSDEAGRNFSTGNLLFVYDNLPPVITINQQRSIGYFAATSTLLSCDVCKLVWSVSDSTNLVSFSNQEVNYSDGSYTIETTLIPEGFVFISFEDEFGRTAIVNLSIISVVSTKFDILNSLIIDQANIGVFCIESPSTIEERDITCLWRRKGVELDNIPLKINVSIDKPELRNVYLQIETDGSQFRTLELRNGMTTIPGIAHYTADIYLTISDPLSQSKPIRVRLIEHTTPWSDFEFIEAELNESENTSNFEILFSPPVGQNEFYIVKGGNGGNANWLGCSVNYDFAVSSRTQPIGFSSTNCTIQEVNFRPDGKLNVKISVGHENVRTQIGLHAHPDSLFNLESFSVLFAYSDILGVDQVMNSQDLRIQEEQISRSDDSATLYQKNNCLLDYQGTAGAGDGFLQSDETAALHRCSDSFIDVDGISSVRWNFTFLDTVGAIQFSMEIECENGFFPEHWNFRDAFDTERCLAPAVPFPSGVFVVTIRPYVLDSSVYNVNGERENEYKAINDMEGNCPVESQDCFIEITIESVMVYPSYDPALEVQNAAKFISDWESSSTGLIIIFNVISVLGIVYIRRKIKAR
jgi:hypothetical protein